MPQVSEHVSEFVKLGRLHPGACQTDLRKDASPFFRDMAEWLDGLAHWERMKWEERCGQRNNVHS